MKSVLLDNGIELPVPARIGTDPFQRGSGITDHRWKSEKVDRWKRAYTHCLYCLPRLFESPLHTAIPAMSKNMLEAENPMNISLRFIGEMQVAGYVRFVKRRQKNDSDKDERVLLPTKKYLKLDIDGDVPVSVEVRPSVVGEDYMSQKIVIRGGVRNHTNIKVASITKAMMEERFTVNSYVLNLLRIYPAIDVDKDLSASYMYNRAIKVAEDLEGKTFRFPQFLDSRSRMYTATTCAMDTQGADHEKALVISTYSEVLTSEGLDGLIEAAHGYSEIDWPIDVMVRHADRPDLYYDEWIKADKPYSYMACANLLSKFVKNPDKPLPAFTPLDGRCSGLQHWSAVVKSNAITRHLGMHEEEAELDIYEFIASKWAETLPEDMRKYATRKAAKIPVMTWGYNATQMTSMEHLGKMYGQISAWDSELGGFKIVREGLERASTNAMGRDIYTRLNDTLGPLTEAVRWVSDAASKISKKGNTDIHWITKDGFECKQRKIEGERLALKVRLSNDKELYLEVVDFSGNKPDHRRHRSAIAPNIIHSLDATHLRMVARRLKLLGVPMIFIHDSFSTHCNYRNVLYKEIIDTFIDLYSGNYLQDLYDYWTGRYGVELDLPPKAGSWEPESLRNLKKFFM